MTTKELEKSRRRWLFWIWSLPVVLLLTLFFACPTTRRNLPLYRIRGVSPTCDHSTSSPNMNGQYRLSMTPGAEEGLFPTNFSQYPDKPTRHFDIYSPMIRSLYSQVFWKSLEPVPLPQNIIQDFHSKIMAIVGFEVDQILELSDGTELSIPINALYNHHYECTMIGGDTQFELTHHLQVQEGEEHMGHGKPLPYWKPSSTNPLDQQEFRGANGGEMRKSFHGYAPGFAQMIRSPHQFQVVPMQIDTWHREEMSLTGGKFVPGPLPKNSLAPTQNPFYSGLLECPVTTRITKHLPLEFQVWNQEGSCPEGSQEVATSQDCFHMVSTLLSSDDVTFVNRSDTAPDRPSGCSLALQTNDTILAFFNYNSSTSIGCGSPNSRLYRSHSTKSSLVHWTLQIDTQTNEVDLTLTGPADVWFAVGFGAQAMKDQPWTIVVEPGETTKVTERILGDHAGGSEIDQPTLQILQEHSSDNHRTIRLQRPATGHAYYDFTAHNMTQLLLISAVGSSPTFGYHHAKEPSSAYLLPVTETGGTCVCQQEPPPFGQSKGGTLQYHPVSNQTGEQGRSESVVWNNMCAETPRSSLLEQKNPTCDLRTYSGGQIACHHMWSLLDADQDIPWPDQPLEYRLKFRFWIQEYDASYHTQVQFATWGIASPVEYDVPKCGPDVPGCSQDSTGQWVHTIHGAFVPNRSGRLVSAHFHCHAPTCLSMSLYMCEQGTPLNECTAETGHLLCRQEALYGSKGNPFQEPGFIAVPPCLWGSEVVGLEEPVDVRGRTLFATKTANATFAHHGEMAWIQVHFLEG